MTMRNHHTCVALALLLALSAASEARAEAKVLTFPESGNEEVETRAEPQAEMKPDMNSEAKSEAKSETEAVASPPAGIARLEPASPQEKSAAPADTRRWFRLPARGTPGTPAVIRPNTSPAPAPAASQGTHFFPLSKAPRQDPPAASPAPSQKVIYPGERARPDKAEESTMHIIGEGDRADAIHQLFDGENAAAPPPAAEEKP